MLKSNDPRLSWIAGLFACAGLMSWLSLPDAVAAESVVLAQNGQAKATIVVSAELLPTKAADKPAPMRGRYVRLGNPADRLMVAEVEAFSGGVNVAKGKPSTQKGQYGGCKAANAVDGDRNPDHDRCAVGDINGWWEVDLGQTTAIDTIVVWNTDERNAKRMGRVNVSVLDEERKPVDWLESTQVLPRWEFDTSLYRTGDAENAYTVQAFKDLCECLAAVTGAELMVKREGEETAGERCVYFGGAAARKLGVDPNTLAGDEWIIKTQDGHLFLCGGREMGVSRAAYHFLEDTVGVGFWSQGDVDCPARPDLAVSDTDLRRTPAFEHRFHHTSVSSVPTVHEIRMGLSRDLGMAAGAGDGSLLIMLEKDADGNYGAKQSEALMAQHPEWYAKDGNGKLAGLQYGAVRTCFFRDLCYSHVDQGTVDRVAGNVIADLRKNEAECRAKRTAFPAAPLVGLHRDDAAPVCACADCKAPGLSHCDRYVAFMNRVTAQVRTAYPNVRIEMAAYLATEQPPTVTKPASGLVAMYAVTGMMRDRPISDPANRTAAEKMRRWGAICPLKVYSYDSTEADLLEGTENLSFPAPDVLHYAEFFRFAKGNNVSRFMIQDTALYRDLPELRVWLFSKLMEDPLQDGDRLLSRFLTGYFGAAAPVLRRYLEFVRTKAEAQPASYGSFCFPLSRVTYFDPDFCITSQSLFAEAEQALAGVPEPARGKYLRRVRWAWLSPTRAFLAWWPLTAQDWVGAGKKIADHPLDHEAILTRYKTVHDDYLAFNAEERHYGGDPRSDAARHRHAQVLESRYVETPVPEPFAEMPRSQIYDFPVAANELIAAEAVAREKDADGRDVLVVDKCKDLWPIRFFNNYDTKIVREIGEPAAVRWNEYAWYYAGRYDGTGSGAWRGNLMYLFAIITPPAYAAEALITLGVADWKRTPFEGWVEMNVVPGNDGPPRPGRYVRLHHPTDRVMVAEVEVYSGGVNVAKGRPATQQGLWNAGYEADKAVDGDTCGETAPQGGKRNSTTSTDIGGWWEVDLGKTVDIERVVVWNLTDSNAPRQIGLKVSLLDENRSTVNAYGIGRNEPSWVFDASRIPTLQEIRVSRVIMTTGPLTPKLAEMKAGVLANLKPGGPEWLLEKAESADALATLPVVWQFKTDPEDRGERESWFSQASDASWADVRVDDFWTRQLPERYLGVGWYSVAFDVPAVAPGRKLYLRFGAVDGDARVWIDGTLAGVQDRPPSEMWDRPFALDVTTLLKPGMRQRFTVRVSKAPGAYEEGIWKPVELRAAK